MWRTSTRVLQITACLMAMVAFLFVRASAVELTSAGKTFNASGEMLHVCASTASGDILEEKSDETAHADTCNSNLQSSRFVDQVAFVRPSQWSPEKPDSVPVKVPIWLTKRALLI